MKRKRDVSVFAESSQKKRKTHRKKKRKRKIFRRKCICNGDHPLRHFLIEAFQNSNNFIELNGNRPLNPQIFGPPAYEDEDENEDTSDESSDSDSEEEDDDEHEKPPEHQDEPKPKPPPHPPAPPPIYQENPHKPWIPDPDQPPGGYPNQPVTHWIRRPHRLQSHKELAAEIVKAMFMNSFIRVLRNHSIWKTKQGKLQDNILRLFDSINNYVNKDSMQKFHEQHPTFASEINEAFEKLDQLYAEKVANGSFNYVDEMIDMNRGLDKLKIALTEKYPHTDQKVLMELHEGIFKKADSYLTYHYDKAKLMGNVKQFVSNSSQVSDKEVLRGYLIQHLHDSGFDVNQSQAMAVVEEYFKSHPPTTNIEKDFADMVNYVADFLEHNPKAKKVFKTGLTPNVNRNTPKINRHPHIIERNRPPPPEFKLTGSSLEKSNTLESLIENFFTSPKTAEQIEIEMQPLLKEVQISRIPLDLTKEEKALFGPYQDKMATSSLEELENAMDLLEEAHVNAQGLTEKFDHDIASESEKAEKIKEDKLAELEEKYDAVWNDKKKKYESHAKTGESPDGLSKKREKILSEYRKNIRQVEKMRTERVKLVKEIQRLKKQKDALRSITKKRQEAHAKWAEQHPALADEEYIPNLLREADQIDFDELDAILDDDFRPEVPVVEKKPSKPVEIGSKPKPEEEIRPQGLFEDFEEGETVNQLEIDRPGVESIEVVEGYNPDHSEYIEPPSDQYEWVEGDALEDFRQELIEKIMNDHSRPHPSLAELQDMELSDIYKLVEENPSMEVDILKTFLSHVKELAFGSSAELSVELMAGEILADTVKGLLDPENIAFIIALEGLQYTSFHNEVPFFYYDEHSKSIVWSYGISGAHSWTEFWMKHLGYYDFMKFFEKHKYAYTALSFLMAEPILATGAALYWGTDIKQNPEYAAANAQMIKDKQDNIHLYQDRNPMIAYNENTKGSSHAFQFSFNGQMLPPGEKDPFTGSFEYPASEGQAYGDWYFYFNVKGDANGHIYSVTDQNHLINMPVILGKPGQQITGTIDPNNPQNVIQQIAGPNYYTSLNRPDINYAGKPGTSEGSGTLINQSDPAYSIMHDLYNNEPTLADRDPMHMTFNTYDNETGVQTTWSVPFFNTHRDKNFMEKVIGAISKGELIPRFISRKKLDALDLPAPAFTGDIPEDRRARAKSKSKSKRAQPKRARANKKRANK